MTLTSNARIPVLIDTDPGADDFFALIRAMIMHKRWYINIVWITTSWGNVPAQSTYDNAIRACMMMDIETKIGKGADKAWAENASHIHGNDGIGWLSKLLPTIKTVPHYDSQQLMIDLLNEYKGELKILAVWPVTNLAKVETSHPWILKQAAQIISMGGAIYVPGNVSPVAEFNYRYDPESADVMLHSWANIVIAPLDLTTTQAFHQSDLQPILGHINHKIHREFLTKLTDFTIGSNMSFRETHYDAGFYVHDASTVGFLLYPHIYQGSFLQIDMELTGTFTKGQSVVDGRNFPKTQTNAYVLLSMKKNRFLEAMTEDFKDFDFGE